MKVQLRRATEKDSNKIWEVRTAAVRGIEAQFYTKEEMIKWSPVEMPEKFNEIVKTGEWYVIEIDQSKEIVATGFLDEKKQSVEAMFVKPQYQRQGFAFRILKKLEERAVEKGFAKLTLESTVNAEPFYNRAGFISIEKTKYHSPAANIDLNCVLMEKKLSA